MCNIWCFLLPAGCRSGAGLRRSLRDQELWQLWQLHSGQVHIDPSSYHHRRQCGDVHFWSGGMLRHNPGVQSRPKLCKFVFVCVCLFLCGRKQEVKDMICVSVILSVPWHLLVCLSEFAAACSAIATEGENAAANINQLSVMLVIITDVSFLFSLSFCLSFQSFLFTTFFSHLFSFLQFFLIIMFIFAAEVAALVFSFIYQGKVSHRYIFSVTHNVCCWQ